MVAGNFSNCGWDAASLLPYTDLKMKRCLVLTRGAETTLTQLPNVGLELPAHPPLLPRRMKAQPARAGATGPEPAGSTRMDPGPMAGSSTIQQLCPQFSLGLRGAGPSVVLTEAKLGSQPAALVSPSGLQQGWDWQSVHREAVAL